MAYTHDGAADYMEGTGLIQQQPLTISAWFRSTDTAAEQFIAGMQMGATRTGHYLCIRGDTAGDPVSARSRTGAGAAYANTTSGYSSGVWHHGCAVFASATSRTAYIDGGNSGTNATSRDPSSATPVVEIGAAADNGDMFFTGDIGTVAFWDVALSADEVASLAKGTFPLQIRPENLVQLFTLFPIGGGSGTTDRIGVPAGGGHIGLFTTGQAKAAEPKIILPRRF